MARTRREAALAAAHVVAQMSNGCTHLVDRPESRDKIRHSHQVRCVAEEDRVDPNGETEAAVRVALELVYNPINKLDSALWSKAVHRCFDNLRRGRGAIGGSGGA